MRLLISLLAASKPLTVMVVWLLGRLYPEAAQTAWRLWRARRLSRQDSQAGGDVSGAA
jgi:hypothetical protein